MSKKLDPIIDAHVEHEFDLITDDSAKVVDPTVAMNLFKHRKNSLYLAQVLSQVPQTRAYIALLTEGERESLALAVGIYRRREKGDAWIRFEKLAKDLSAYSKHTKKQLALPTSTQLALPETTQIFSEQDIEMFIKNISYDPFAKGEPLTDIDTLSLEDLKYVSEKDVKDLYDLSTTLLLCIKGTYRHVDSVLVSPKRLEPIDDIFTDSDDGAIEITQTQQYRKLILLNSTLKDLSNETIIEPEQYEHYGIVESLQPPPLTLEHTLFED
jgi:hypothetical protein